MHATAPAEIQKLGIIAGNGQMPLLVLDEAVRRGVAVMVAAIKEETFPEIENVAERGAVPVHWMGLGQLGKLVQVLKEERVSHACMVGQVKHVRIFAPGSRAPWNQLKHLPDWRMLKLLASLPKRNTATLIGSILELLEDEGIRFIDSTHFLQHLLAEKGPLTSRAPEEVEQRDMEYGRQVAMEIARLDIGQTVVIKDQAIVAVEAMEGTDETIRRAAALVGGQRLTVVKVSRPKQDMRYDVPVIGNQTLEVMIECGVSALAVDSGRTLILDKEQFLQNANRAGITIMGF